MQSEFPIGTSPEASLSPRVRGWHGRAALPGSVSVLCCSVLAAVLALLGCCLSLCGAEGQRGSSRCHQPRPSPGALQGSPAALPGEPSSHPRVTPAIYSSR